jgi:hypothetical protein
MTLFPYTTLFRSIRTPENRPLSVLWAPSRPIGRKERRREGGKRKEWLNKFSLSRQIENKKQGLGVLKSVQRAKGWNKIYPDNYPFSFDPESSFRNNCKFIIYHSREWQKRLFDIIWFFTLWSSSWDHTNRRKCSTDLEKQASIRRQDVNLYVFITEFFNNSPIFRHPLQSC